MNDNPANPARLKDQHDQADLVERIAGQVARNLPEPTPLQAHTLARIATSIEARMSKPHSAFHLGRVLVAASILLGLVTVASAARLDLMPRWIAKRVGRDSKPILPRPIPRVGQSRPAGKKIELPTPAPENPPTVTAPPNSSPPSTEETPSPVKAAEPPLANPAPTLASPRPVRLTKSDSKTAMADTGLQPRKTPSLAMLDAKVAAPSPAAQPAPAIGVPAPVPTTTIARPQPVAPAPMIIPTPSERPAPRPTPARPEPPPPMKAQPTSALAPPPAASNPAARHLKEVVRALRVDRAPRTALDMLDRYANELAGNAFAEESLLLRVEALLALGQPIATLRLLDGTPLTEGAASSVLLLTRGQLRATANRCSEAIGDFDLALARAHRPSKPALLGRAHCKQKLGDPTGAQADLDRYRREFPGEPGP